MNDTEFPGRADGARTAPIGAGRTDRGPTPAGR
jgi:hypothetical protein